MNLPSLPSDPPKEPAVAVGTTTGTLGGLIFLILTLFPDLLSEKQTQTIMVVGAFLLPIISGVITRGRVWSPYSVKELLDTGIRNAQKELEDAKNRRDEIARHLEKRDSPMKRPEDSDFFGKPES